MFTPFIISLREGIEIFLVIIPLVVYFKKNKLHWMTKNVLIGGTLVKVIAAVVGFIIFSQVEQL